MSTTHKKVGIQPNAISAEVLRYQGLAEIAMAENGGGCHNWPELQNYFKS
jgi:hypothetical protein